MTTLGEGCVTGHPGRFPILAACGKAPARRGAFVGAPAAIAYSAASALAGCTLPALMDGSTDAR